MLAAFFIAFGLSFSVWADRYVPRSMTASDRKIALQVLGFGSASKVLGNPYPLGGRTGFEVGVSSEFIPVQDLASLGDKSSRRSELNYFNLSLAKGLFHNIDTMIQFTPAFQKEEVASYGGQIRWGFYDFPFIPGGLSAVFHGSATNFGSLVDTRTSGIDIVATVVVDDVALYFGMGQARSLGTFIGGSTNGGRTESTTDACALNYCDTAYEDLVENHTLFGVSLQFSDFFATFEIDRYYLSAYSAKLGWRF